MKTKEKKDTYNLAKEIFETKDLIVLPKLNQSIKNQLSKAALLTREYIFEEILNNPETVPLLSISKLSEKLDIGKEAIRVGIRQLKDLHLFLVYQSQEGTILLPNNRNYTQVYKELQAGKPTADFAKIIEFDDGTRLSVPYFVNEDIF